jgi:hypothetical protein
MEIVHLDSKTQDDHLTVLSRTLSIEDVMKRGKIDLTESPDGQIIYGSQELKHDIHQRETTVRLYPEESYINRMFSP